MHRYDMVQADNQIFIKMYWQHFHKLFSESANQSLFEKYQEQVKPQVCLSATAWKAEAGQ